MLAFPFFLDEIEHGRAIVFPLGYDIWYFICFRKRQQFNPMLDLEVSFEVISRSAYTLDHILVQKVIADSKILCHCFNMTRFSRKKAGGPVSSIDIEIVRTLLDRYAFHYLLRKGSIVVLLLCDDIYRSLRDDEEPLPTGVVGEQ